MPTSILVVDFMWIIGQFVVPHVDIVGLPIRVCVGSLMAAQILAAASQSRLLWTRSSRMLLWPWMVYCLLGLVSTTFNGDLGTAGLLTTAALWFSQYGVATLAFLYFSSTLRTKRHLAALLWVMLGISSASALLAWFQASGEAWAWQIASEVCGPPTGHDRPDVPIAPVGLGVFSVTSATCCLCFGVAAAGLMIKSQDQPERLGLAFFRVAAFIAFGLCLSAGVPFLSRSSMLIAPVCVAAMIIAYGKSALWSASLILLTGIAGVLVVPVLSGSLAVQRLTDRDAFDASVNATRLSSLESDDRVETWQGALTAIQERPLFGGKISAASGAMSRTNSPHNVFLGSAVYYGIPAACVLMLFVFTQLGVCWRVLRSTPHNRTLNLKISIAIALVVYNLKGLFHNDNFSHGGILGMMLLGLILAPADAGKGGVNCRSGKCQKALALGARGLAVTLPSFGKVRTMRS